MTTELTAIDFDKIYNIEEFLNLDLPEDADYELESIENLYSFRREEEVREFLQNYTYLIPFLITAQDKFKAYFENSKLWLEVMPDPEAPKHSHLVIWVETALEPGEAVARLDQMVQAWWLNLPNRLLGKISANLEFV